MKELFGVLRRVRFERLLKLLYFVLFGDALLLLSAIAENGETELSRRLITGYWQVPEMLEALLMCLLILVSGAFAYYLAERERGAK